MAEQDRRGGHDDAPAVPPRARGATTDSQLTVEALLARSREAAVAGTGGRRRADRRTSSPAPPSRPASSAPRPNTTTPPPPPRPSSPPPARPTPVARAAAPARTPLPDPGPVSLPARTPLPDPGPVSLPARTPVAVPGAVPPPAAAPRPVPTPDAAARPTPDAAARPVPTPDATAPPVPPPDATPRPVPTPAAARPVPPPPVPARSVAPAPVPAPGTSELPASGIVAAAPGTSALPAQTAGPRPTLPPVPAAEEATPAPPGRLAARRAERATSAARAAVTRQSGPVPPLPGTERHRRQSGPVPPLPGTERARQSAPVPPLPGLRPSAPLPPIPGRDVPVPEVHRTRAEKWAALSPLHRRLVRAAVVVSVLVALVGGFYVGLYVYADRSVDRVAALSTTAPEILAPQLQDGATTWLVLGTGAPGEDGPAALSASLLRLTGDGQQAVVLDVPSTALLDSPECRTPDGDLRQPVTEPLAQTLAAGGPGCLVRAVQQLSGLRVDHYLDVDLGRAGDGVPPSCPTDALPVADLATLLNPVRAVSTATGAADVATTDEDTSLAELRGLAETLRALPADAVERSSLPVARPGYLPVGSTTAAVVLDGSATRDLFDSVISTGELPQPAPADPAATPVTGADVSVTLPPSSVTVSVLDATGDTTDPATGAGASTMAALAAQGFVPGAMGIEPAAVPTSLVRYAPDAVEAARTVAAAVPGAVLEPTAAPGAGVQLVVASPDLPVSPVAVGAAVPETALPAQPATATCG